MRKLLKVYAYHYVSRKVMDCGAKSLSSILHINTKSLTKVSLSTGANSERGYDGNRE